MIDAVRAAPSKAPHYTQAETKKEVDEEHTYYATRLSTVVLVKRGTGEVLFVERDEWVYGRDGEPELVDHEKKGEAGGRYERRFRFGIHPESESRGI